MVVFYLIFRIRCCAIKAQVFYLRGLTTLTMASAGCSRKSFYDES